MVVRHFPGINTIIYPNLPIIETPLSHWSANRGYVLLQGIAIIHHRYTDTPELQNIL